MVVIMLKNWSHRYASRYIIKFIGLILIYYAINLENVSSFMIFSNLYLEFINLLQIWINKMIFSLKKKSICLFKLILFVYLRYIWTKKFKNM